MSGHSKWNNIKRKKGAADAARAKVFTKIGREIQLAVRNGGPDPTVNRQLRDIISKAKSANMPNDNIERSIKKAAGGGDNSNYEEIRYEGYGPAGVAILVRALTDNRNRTAGDVRHAFDKWGGNLGTTGSASFMFTEKGCIVVDGEEIEDSEALMMAALEAGAADFEEDGELYLIYTEADDLDAVRDEIEKAGYTIAEADVHPVAENLIAIQSEEQQTQMQKLLDMLDDNDDVQDVWHNWDEAGLATEED